ncbi:MAG: CDP-glycerol glycerophosphotransferase family protein [Acutalibacteraceae bacterium]
MKSFFYKLYALFFNLSARLFKIDPNLVCLVSMHNEGFCDCLGCVYEKLKEKENLKFAFITREDLSMKNPFKALSFFLFKSRLLAKSKYVFLNDNFLPMALLNFKEETVITQLWHAEGVFKKFGLHINQPDSVRKNEIEANKKLTWVLCSGEEIKGIYAEAFGVKNEQVLCLGAPRCDYLLTEGNGQKALEEIHRLYPESKNKKIVLYAPTFRDTKEKNADILNRFNPQKLSALLGEDYIIFVKLHPQVHENCSVKNAVDVTDYTDVRKLTLACDVLITDYSSICMDFSLLDKKTVFFAYDLEDYKLSRDFYFDYELYVPGAVAFTLEDCAKAVKGEFLKEKNEAFKNKNFSYFDNQSSKRIIDFIIK